MHRQEALLWRYALELDYDGVDDLVRQERLFEPRTFKSTWERRMILTALAVDPSARGSSVG